jgi:hypothetical protein
MTLIWPLIDDLLKPFINLHPKIQICPIISCISDSHRFETFDRIFAPFFSISMDFSSKRLLSVLLLYLSLPLATNATTVCAIIGSDGPVHCRACPHITCKLITTLPVGTKLNFTSYAVGDCSGNNW